MRITAPQNGVRQRLTHVPVYYGWFIVGACFLIALITWGTVWSFGVFFGHFIEEFGLSHANTSLVFSLQQILMFVSAAVLGFVVDRYGAQRLLVVAMGLVVVGLFGVVQFASFAGVLVSYSIVAATGFGILFVISYATPSRWFGRRRGLATGIATAGAGVGVLAVPPVAEVLIARVGWRGVYAGLLVVFVIVLVFAILVIADRPTDLDVDPSVEFSDGVPDAGVSTGGVWAQVTEIAGVAGSPAFGLMFAAFLCFGVPLSVLNVNILEYTTNIGLGRAVGVLALSVFGGLNVAGKFIGGAVSDRIGRPWTIAASGVLMAVGIGILLVVPSRLAVLSGAVVFGFGWGIWIGLLAPLLADLFGTLSINALFGITTIAFALANSIAPYLAGLGFDAFGSYSPAFAIAGLVGIVGGGLVLVAARLAPAS